MSVFGISWVFPILFEVRISEQYCPVSDLKTANGSAPLLLFHIPPFLLYIGDFFFTLFFAYFMENTAEDLLLGY